VSGVPKVCEAYVLMEPFQPSHVVEVRMG